MTLKEKFKLQERLGIDLDLVSRELCIPPEVVLRVVKSSLASTDESIEKLAAAIAGKDLVAVERIVHELRGVCANLRITPLADIAGRMKDAARSNAAAERLPGLLAEFRGKFGVLREIFG